MEDITRRRFLGLTSLIGNTPLLAIDLKYRGESRRIYAKAENLNMTGSIKDRMAIHILRKAYVTGALKPGDTIIEATSGNTGISFSAIGRALGHPVIIFMPDWMSNERTDLIRNYGAEIRLVTKEEGGFIGSIEMADQLATKMGETAFLPHQFSNNDNSQAHYETTGPEIWAQLAFRSVMPDAFVAGIGTGGTIMGAGKYLKEKNQKIKLFPLEPENSPTLTTGWKIGKHRIQGISDEFIPQILDLDFLNDVICVDDGDAILMAQKLSRQLGLGVGISSGANLIGALKVQESMGSNSLVVTVFADDNKKYFSTDLMKDEATKEEFYSPDIELISFQAYKRVCETCCDPEECGFDYALELVEGKQLPDCARRP